MLKEKKPQPTSSKGAPSDAGQRLRTERNKARRIAKNKAPRKVMAVPRGTARASRRLNENLRYDAQLGIPSTGE